METLQLLGVALGLATLAGINLYLTVCLTGLAIRFEWILLDPRYQQLEILAHPAIIAIAGILYLIEFFADKVPWLDSAWDSVHTIVRPVGGTLLAIQVLGDSDPVFEVIVAMVACGMSLMTHSLKAGTRIVVNGSPEPISNVALSFAEDVTVVGGLWLLHFNPVVALGVFLLGLGIAWYFAPRLFRAVKFKLWLIWRKLQAPAGEGNAPVLLARLPAGADILFHALDPGDTAIEWAVPCVSGKSKGIPPYAKGHLIATASELETLYFVAPRKFGKVARRLDLRGYKASREPKFLSENLVLYSVNGGPRYLFLFDRPRGAMVERIATLLSLRLAGESPAADARKTEDVVSPEHASSPR